MPHWVPYENIVLSISASNRDPLKHWCGQRNCMDVKHRLWEQLILKGCLHLRWQVTDVLWGSAGLLTEETSEPLRNWKLSKSLKSLWESVNCSILDKSLGPESTNEIRSRGRPRSRWGDDIEQSTGRSLAEYTETARERRQWRALVYESITPTLKSWAQEKNKRLLPGSYMDKTM